MLRVSEQKDFIIRFPFANALVLNHYKRKLGFTPSLKTLFTEPTKGLPFELCSALSLIITKYQFYKICYLISLLLNNGAFHMRNINTVFYLYIFCMANYGFENNEQQHNCSGACAGVVDSLIWPLRKGDNCSSVNLAKEPASKLAPPMSLLVPAG